MAAPAKKKMSMKEAYDATAPDNDDAPAKPKAVAPKFVSKKVGTRGDMTTCPECGAHFKCEYT